MDHAQIISKTADHEIFETPPITPKIRVWKYQWIGMMILIAIPVLALFGVFGESTEFYEIRGRGLKASVEYPYRMRLGQTEYIRLEVTNVSDRKLNNITAKLNHNYLKNFDDIEAIPSLDNDFEIPVGEILQDESKVIYFKLKAGDFGHHQGKLSFLSSDRPILKTNFKTLVLP